MDWTIDVTPSMACPVCRRVWLEPVESGPAGARFRCGECRVVVVFPRVAFGKAWRKAFAKGWRK